MDTSKALKALVKNHALQSIFLIETKSKERRMQALARRLGFSNCDVVEV